MIWLVAALLILQMCFYWGFKPAILFLTPIFDLRGLPLLLLLVGAWLFSGRGIQDGPREIK